MNDKQLNGYMEGYAAASALSKEAGATAEVLKQLGAAGAGAGLGALGDYAMTGDVGWGAPTVGALAGSGAYNAYKYRKDLAKMLGLGGESKTEIDKIQAGLKGSPMPEEEFTGAINKLRRPFFTDKQIAEATKGLGRSPEELAMKVDAANVPPEQEVAGISIEGPKAQPGKGLSPEAYSLLAKFFSLGKDALTPSEVSTVAALLPSINM